MLWFKRVLGFAVALALALATLVFVLENQMPSTLAFLGFQSAELPVAVFLVMFFVAGGLLGLLLGLLVYSRLKLRLRNLEARLRRLDDERKQLHLQLSERDVSAA
ncbi:lipopolysaccharide assembly protein LapA domain-containing protein [Pseudomonas mangrovi]|jgi:putative membrane protein|uniref:DUF1049 domain-containing protein n=1 Tax=Pseudomonas mangrovi TaxID=2161748 RepID=A0A2T5P661_9PSED|nr:lipopolysaccharide assembly protein LapA domain-containing protein [Pseudomonas mangrovi]PTU73216.1 DUF1049 domain-containing protein [Pseudomonas mangrovi]